jgi:protein N-terminal methyltransferase
MSSQEPDLPASAADAAIDHDAAIDYWSNTTADDDGVLGGFPHVSKADLQGSANFLAKLRRKSNAYPASRKLGHVVDCGAGIGRVSLGFLSKVADRVDIVEPVIKFTDVISAGDDFRELREAGVVGEIYNVGLQDWKPAVHYDLIWNQWCVGQLTDAQFKDYLRRVKDRVNPGGWIVVKENLSSSPDGADIFDSTDSSVTRTDVKFRQIFEEVGLQVVASELQRGMPMHLYKVRSYALQPASAGKAHFIRFSRLTYSSGGMTVGKPAPQAKRDRSAVGKANRRGRSTRSATADSLRRMLGRSG